MKKNLASTCSDWMMGVEGGTEINLKSGLDMSTKQGLLWVWIKAFFSNSKPNHTWAYLKIFITESF